jgi:hypothetical protein
VKAPEVQPLTPLELASGLVFGDGGRPADLPLESPPVPPRAALERAVLPALRRPPCLVSFSGGRDSSAILAVATAVARREGLALPIPATNRFPTADGTLETEWQERVIAYLGIEDWIRRDLTDELDCVGPVATRVLRRHGVLWPCNTHFHDPLFEAAAGGSVLTGIGGDEAFMSPAGAITSPCSAAGAARAPGTSCASGSLSRRDRSDVESSSAGSPASAGGYGPRC